MSVYIKIIENGVLKKYIPGLTYKAITLPTDAVVISSCCLSPWSPEKLPLGEILNDWDNIFITQTIVIPRNVKLIEKLAFVDIPNLRGFIVEKGCTAAKLHKDILYSGSGQRLICCPPQKRGEYTIPVGVEIISENAFENTQLSRVFLPDTVAVIEDDAFTGGKINSIYIPWSVANIGESVFEDCQNLVIETPRNSHAMDYAKKHGIPTKEILYITPT